MIVWVDVETTGLDYDRDRLLEVAMVVTSDDARTELARASSIFPQEIPSGCYEAHFTNGLVDEIVSLRERGEATWPEDEDARFASILDVALAGERSPLGGATPSFDRRWMERFYPKTMLRLSHRHIDVSTLKEVGKRIAPGLEIPKDREAHRAMQDILETIDLYHFYLGPKGILKTTSPGA